MQSVPKQEKRHMRAADQRNQCTVNSIDKGFDYESEKCILQSGWHLQEQYLIRGPCHIAKDIARRNGAPALPRIALCSPLPHRPLPKPWFMPTQTRGLAGLLGPACSPIDWHTWKSWGWIYCQPFESQKIPQLLPPPVGIWVLLTDLVPPCFVLPCEFIWKNVLRSFESYRNVELSEKWWG